MRSTSVAAELHFMADYAHPGCLSRPSNTARDQPRSQSSRSEISGKLGESQHIFARQINADQSKPRQSQPDPAQLTDQIELRSACASEKWQTATL